MRLRGVLGPLFTDEAFAGLFSGRGGRRSRLRRWCTAGLMLGVSWT